MHKLFILVFTLATLISATLNASAEQDFSWDIDGDGQENALTDGLLVIRYLFGFTELALVQGAVGNQAVRKDYDSIKSYLESNESYLDVDNNGKVSALTDGLLIIRYLFGFRGDALVQNSIADDAIRNTSSLVESYLASNVKGGGDAGNVNQELASEVLFKSDISPLIQNRCITCHAERGPAAATPLRYLPSSDPNHLANNYGVLANYINASQGNGDRLLAKASGGTAHGGGAVISNSGTEYAALEEFIRLVKNEQQGSGDEQKTPLSVHSQFFKSATMLSAEATLRRATILTLGRNPTPAELQILGEGSSLELKAAIKLATTDPKFHDFLIRGANDRLLTDAFLNGIPVEQSALESNVFYPIGTNEHADAQAEAGERFFHWPKYDHWRWGLSRSPLELIAYIVSNDRDYREVLTADYTMMNYAMNDFLNGGANFDSLDSESFPYCARNSEKPCYDHKQFKPGINRGQSLLDNKIVTEDTGLQTQKIIEHSPFVNYPHAGVLNTQAFLNRYPSTETNRNRARARWTFYHFLGIDIEKSAPRTTDPVALADTNNPTMKNPACTVCHQVLDPVAGSFQHYGNAGYYHESYGGEDSLADQYKWSTPNPALSDTYITGTDFVVPNETFGPIYEVQLEAEIQTLYIRVEFVNDYSDEAGDRNAFFDSLEVEGPNHLWTKEFESISGGWYGCGNHTDEAYGQYCNGGVVFPIEITEPGNYALRFRLAGEQHGNQPVKVRVAVDSDPLGSDKLKYLEGDTWYRDMRAPGFLSGVAPAGQSSLQWLARQMVEDPWFAEAAVKFWWPSLMGQEVETAPEVMEDESFESKLALYEAQQSYIRELADQFSSGIDGGQPFNGRDLIVALLSGPWFRLMELATSDPLPGSWGGRRLLTPEELDAKFASIAGFYWGNNSQFNEWDISGRHTRLTQEFQILYGGIDSRNVTKRSEHISPVMLNIAEKLALENACEIVVRTLQSEPEDRRILENVTLVNTPENYLVAQKQAAVSTEAVTEILAVTEFLDSGNMAIQVSFDNPFGDQNGQRTARLDKLIVTDPEGLETIFELESPPEGTVITGCGHSVPSFYYQLSCKGDVSIPFEVNTDGLHKVRLIGMGEQYGDEPVKVTLSLISQESGQEILKQNIVELHALLLGETLEPDHEEIAATYALLEESFQFHKSSGFDRINDWPKQSCLIHGDPEWPLDLEDPTYMKGAWINVLTYLMTDFGFLHE